MKKTVFISISFGALLIVAFIYTLFFPVQLTTRPVYKVDSIIGVENGLEITQPDAYFIEHDKIVYFSIEKEAVTFAEDLSVQNEEYCVAGNINGFVKYKKDGTLLQFFSPNGSLLNEQRHQYGYP